MNRKTITLSRWLSAVALLTFTSHTLAQIRVKDDHDKWVELNKPAQRIISLSPHVTELLFAAGAGDKIVGTVTHSDFPESALAIPRVGSNRALDMEKILSLKPDLIVMWMHGAFEKQLEAIKQSGIPYYFSDPKKLEEIPTSIKNLGEVAGTSKHANTVAQDYLAQIKQLEQQAKDKALVTVFYQVWGKPIYTLNRAHIVDDAIRLCGGKNIFAQLASTAPIVSIEAVVKENPDVIISGNMNAETASLEQWKKFPTMSAVKTSRLFSMDGDLLNRAGPRVIEGTRQICKMLEKARK